MDYSTWFYFKLNRIAHRDPIYSIKLFGREDSLFGGQVWVKLESVEAKRTCHSLRLHSESWSRSDYIQVFCCLPTPHRLGNPIVECIVDITLFLILLINANLCKFLINFLLFPNGALSHWNVKFRLFISKRCCFKKCLIHSNYLVNVYAKL